MRLLSRICSAHDVDLPLRSLFENATLAKLAAAIDVTPRRSQGLSVPVLRRRNRKRSGSSHLAQGDDPIAAASPNRRP